MIDRRSFLFGLGAFVAAPAIVRYSNLMPLPRAPFVQLPSGLWVKAINRAAGTEKIFAAHAEVASGMATVTMNVDQQITCDYFIVGRDQNELFYTDTGDFSARGMLCAIPGDIVTIKAGVTIA